MWSRNSSRSPRLSLNHKFTPPPTLTTCNASLPTNRIYPPVYDHLAIVNHQQDVLEIPDVAERVALDRHEVGFEAGSDGSRALLNAHAFGRDGGRGLDSFHRKHPDCD